MKFPLIFLMLFITTLLVAQSNPRAQYEKELADLIEAIKDETQATFKKGPIFYFDEPHKAVFNRAGDYPVSKDPNGSMEKFLEGDTILVIGAAPIGKSQRFTRIGSDKVYETKIIGRPGFEIIDFERYKAQMTKIKASDWKRPELLAGMLSCGSLAGHGKPNFEKHHINFGDTPVFYQVRMENDKILLYFMLRTYGGNDFKNVGSSESGKSKIDITFADGTTRSYLCEGEGENDTHAIVDITGDKSMFLAGVDEIAFSLSQKEVSRPLLNEDKFSIGLKMECMKP